MVGGGVLQRQLQVTVCRKQRPLGEVPCTEQISTRAPASLVTLPWPTFPVQQDISACPLSLIYQPRPSQCLDQSPATGRTPHRLKGRLAPSTRQSAVPCRRPAAPPRLSRHTLLLPEPDGTALSQVLQCVLLGSTLNQSFAASHWQLFLPRPSMTRLVGSVQALISSSFGASRGARITQVF